MAKRKKAPKIPKRLPPKWEVGDVLSNGWVSGSVAAIIETTVDSPKDIRHRHPLRFYALVSERGFPMLAEEASLVEVGG